MKKSILIFSIIFSSILIILAYFHSLHAEEKTKIAIVGLEAKIVGQEMADIISDAIAVEISNIGGFEVITKGDMKAMLDLESQKQLMGCDDVSCIAEIGGALGVDKILTGSLGKFGRTFILSISLVNVSQARVENRVSERVKGEIDQLLDALKPMMAKLFGEKPIVKVEKRKEEIPTGNLKIESSVKGAEIYLNGEKVGRAPQTLKVIKIGRHKLKLMSKGYYTWEKDVKVEADKTSIVEAELISKAPIKEKKQKEFITKPWYKKWWVWSIIGGVVVGGSVATYAIIEDGSAANYAIIEDEESPPKMRVKW